MRLTQRARSRSENRVGLIAGHAACRHLPPRPKNQIHNLHRHSAADASRPAALLIGRILPVFFLFVPSGPSASSLSVPRCTL